MKSFRTRIAIRATPAAIWKILVDAPAYPSWNPTVSKLEGRIAPGEQIKLHVTGSGRAFALKVVAWEPERRMVWAGGMPLGLFKGVRTYTLTPQADGAVEFAMIEEFSGAMAGLITRSIPDLQPSFDAFAAALKARAEAA